MPISATQDGYVKILETKLWKQKIKVINAGLGGDKTTAALALLRSAVIALKPVSIFLGANDAAVGRGIRP